MNILFRKGTSNSAKDDPLVLLNANENKKTNDDDDDILIVTSPNNKPNPNPNPTLLTQTVQQLFGKTSSSSSSSSPPTNPANYTDEKLLTDQNNPDDQLLDLN